MQRTWGGCFIGDYTTDAREALCEDGSLCFFANDERPYFQRDGQMGSWIYARACRLRGDDIKIVLSLETMG